MTDSLRDAATFPVWHETAQVDWQPEAAPSAAEVDVAIVGGGLSGLWTAFYLSEAEPRTRIAVVEARRIGPARRHRIASRFWSSMPNTRLFRRWSPRPSQRAARSLAPMANR